MIPDVQTHALLNQISKRKKFKPVLVANRKMLTMPASPIKTNSPISKTLITKKIATPVAKEETIIEPPDSQEKILLPGGAKC